MAALRRAASASAVADAYIRSDVEARSPLRGGLSSPRSPLERVRHFLSRAPSCNGACSAAADEAAEIELLEIELELEELRLRELELSSESKPEAQSPGQERREQLQHKLRAIRAQLQNFVSHGGGARRGDVAAAQARLAQLLRSGKLRHIPTLSAEVAALHDELAAALRRHDRTTTADHAALPPVTPPPPVRLPPDDLEHYDANTTRPPRRVGAPTPAAAPPASAAAARPSGGALPPPRRAFFCLSCAVASCAVFAAEMHANGWAFQPLVCDSSTTVAAASSASSTPPPPCEANAMLGPSVRVLDALGAKNDVNIFEHGEWWRLLSCQWLHAGVLHLVLNLASLGALGVGVERVLGSLRAAGIFLAAGAAGTLCSALWVQPQQRLKQTIPLAATLWATIASSRCLSR